MKEMRLKNGLTVYVQHKPIGESAVCVGINSGSWQDKILETAHTTEHVMGVLTGVYGERGVLNYANTNARTEPQRTTYFLEGMLPKHVQLAIQNLKIVFSLPDSACARVLEREKDAVRHELKPRLHPLFQFAHDTIRLLFPVYTREHVPQIKERLESVDTIMPSDITTFWTKHYTPQNAFVYIAGEVPLSLDELLSDLENVPGSNSTLPEKPVFGKEQVLTQRVELKQRLRDDSVASVQIAYQTPSFPHTCSLKEEKAIELLTAFLGADHGPVYQRLRDEKRLCYSLGVEYDTQVPVVSGLFFNVTTAPASVEEVEKEWIYVIHKIAKEGISDNTLATFKNRAQITTIRRSRRFDLGGVVLKIDDGITREDIQKEVNKLTTEDITCAAKMLVEKPYIISIALPK